MKAQVAIVGAGMTQFGKLKGEMREIHAEAVRLTLEDTSISAKDIDAMYVGTWTPDLFLNQLFPAPMLADSLGLNNIPVSRVEDACATGSVAFRQAAMAVMSGLHRLVLVTGVEVMTQRPTRECVKTIAYASDRLWEQPFGITFPSSYALLASRHMHKYGTTPEQLAAVSVKNHRYSAKNPKAQYGEVTLEQVLSSKMVSWPLRLLDCCPISDGAAALVIARAEEAKKYTDTPVYVLGSGQARASLSLHDRPSLTSIPSTKQAAETAYRMAGVEAGDVDVAEVHDCFTIAEILAVEDLGFFKKGEGGKAVEEGSTEIGGKIPVNVSGGLLGKGHPIGATGVAQMVEIFEQLRGESGSRQVPGAEIGLTHNVGGTGGVVTVHIFSVKGG
ncbi:thiolase domain-containing protein [Candidatus Hecatella orcuttiae]|uniref:thiolase domain-containing protein n=1 Tax=Candidatus Hecatella orcuttiae TaxID=1935119 RepID=UPI0028680644|nr:thiolase domain-containing protein [Candidatus Hecatella orcuttiae]